MAGGLHVPQLLTGFMTRIVTTRYRHMRPPRKRKAVALEAPAIVAAKSRRPTWEDQAAAEVPEPPTITTTGQRAQSIKHTARGETRRIRPTTAGSWRSSPHENLGADRGFSDAPDLTPEELQRRGDAADALWRELVARLRRSRGEAPSQALDECFQRAP